METITLSNTHLSESNELHNSDKPSILRIRNITFRDGFIDLTRFLLQIKAQSQPQNDIVAENGNAISLHKFKNPMKKENANVLIGFEDWQIPAKSQSLVFTALNNGNIDFDFDINFDIIKQ